MSTEHLHNPLTGEHLRFLRTGRDTGGELLEAEVRLDPGGRVPRHVHLRQDESVEVREGSVTITVGGQERVLATGDRADVPRRKTHTIRNPGDRQACLLLQGRPARRMEAGMRALFAAGSALGHLRRRRPG